MRAADCILPRASMIIKWLIIATKQAYEIQTIAKELELLKYEYDLPDAFVAVCIIAKLPRS